MSLYRSGLEWTINEIPLVPGKLVQYGVQFEVDNWQGKPKSKEPVYEPKPVAGDSGMQFGGDPHKQTINQISKALGDLISNKELINRRDWR
jgi:hypothetical protein